MPVPSPLTKRCFVYVMGRHEGNAGAIMELRWDNCATAGMLVAWTVFAALPPSMASAQEPAKEAASSVPAGSTATTPEADAPKRTTATAKRAAAVTSARNAASPVRGKCAAEGQREMERKAVTSTPVFIGAGAGGIIGAVIGTVIITAIESERRKSIRSEAETKCLVAAGLAPMGQAPAAKGEGRVRNASTGASGVAGGSSGNASKCACKEMKSCSGSWLNMSCNQLKATCRNARTNTIVWMKNSCEKLESLVGAL
jgi:hypothetical protein